MSLASALYVGAVTHQRLRPKPHRLRYRIYSLLLDLDEVPALAARLRLFSHRRFNLFGFDERDHADGSGAPLRGWVEKQLAMAGIDLENGAIRLLAMPRAGATPALVVRVWRELIAESLSLQGPFHLAVWGGRDPGRAVELARLRFGAAPPLHQVGKPEDALAAARTPGGVAIAALSPDSAWWGRLLAEPKLKVFAALPCLDAWGPLSALAVGEVAVEPSGDDRTFWVTDAAQTAAAVEEALSRDGVAATLVTEAGGLKLFMLAGFFQADDERLARAPGGLSGVIGAAPSPLDV